MSSAFLKKPLNKIEFACRDVMVSAIYGFLRDIRAGGEYHDHIGFELHLIREGEGFMMTEEEKLVIAPGTVILVPPHTKHYPAPFKEAAFEDLTVMFSYRHLADRSEGRGKSLYRQFEELLPQRDQVVSLRRPFYEECFGEIREVAAEQDTVLGHALMQNLLESLLLHLLKDLGERKQSGQKGAGAAPSPVGIEYRDFLVVKRIDEYIQRLSPDVTLDGLAEYINMSKRSTQRLVSGLYGQSFTQKLAEFRLNAAVELMKREEKTLAQIAGEVGYKEYTTFHKAFLKRFGVQPSEYRRNRKG